MVHLHKAEGEHYHYQVAYRDVLNKLIVNDYIVYNFNIKSIFKLFYVTRIHYF